MDFKKTLTVEVNQKGVSSAANALGKLAVKASEVDKPLWYAKNTLEHFNGLKLDAVTLQIKGVADQVRQFQTNVSGLGELASGMKGISGSFTSIATAAERLVSSTSGLDSFNTKLQAIRDTLQSMQGLSGTLTGISKVPSGVTVRGGGGGGSTADPDKAMAAAQKRFLSDVTRQYMVKTQGPAAYLEQKAAMLGVTKETGPMIAALRATEKQMQGVGGMSRQTAAAMRMVPAQFTDIATQLAGGQNPLLIMLQQGGQLRDMFGGFGNMFKNVGGMVLKFLTNPFTLAALAVGSLAGAYYFGSKEAENFGKSAILTGNAVGMSKDKFTELTAEAGKLAGGQSAAAEAMTALASTGKITGNSIEKLTASTANFARASGKDIQDVANEYASLKDKPVEALLKLNESYHFLSEATYEQVKALEKEGNALGATKLAQDALSQAHGSMTAQLQQNLGLIERSLNSVIGKYRELKNWVLDVGREESTSQKVASMNEELTFLDAKAKRQQQYGRQLGADDSARIAELRSQIASTTTLNGRNEASLKNSAARQQAEESAIKAAAELEKLEGRGTSNVKKKTDAYKALERQLAAVRAVNPYSDQLKPEAVAAAKRAIEEDYKDKGGGFKSSDNRLATLQAEQQALQQEIEGLQNQGSAYEKVTEHAKRLLAVKNLLAAGGGKPEQMSALKKEETALTTIVQLEDRKAKLIDESKQLKDQQDIAASIEVTSLSLQEQLKYIKETGAVSDTRTKIEKDLAKARADASNESLSINVRNAAALNSIGLERIDNEDKYNKSVLKTMSARLQADQSEIANASTLATLAESQQKEVEWLAMSNKEKEKAQSLWNIELEARKKILEIEKQKESLKGNTEALEQKDREIEGVRQTATAQASLVQAFEKTKDSGLSFYGDMRVASQNWLESLPTQQQEIQSVFSSTYSSMAEVMGNFITSGKASWRDFAKSVMTNIAQMMLKIAMLKTAQAVVGLVGGGDFASTGGNSSAVGAMAAGYGGGRGSINAQGNAFTMSGVAAFARGGAFTNSVVSSPTMFAFASGGVPSMGVMGEKPGSVGEAVMPLTRNSKGDLGVAAVGGGSPQISIEVNVASDGSSSSKTTGDSQRDARDLAKSIEAVVLKVITQQQRSGGRLASA